MVLAQPLRDLGGRTLLKSGAELTAAYIEHIRRWGFEEVTVEGGADAPQALPPVIGYPVAGRSWDRISAEIEKRFSRSGGNRTLARLKAAVLARVRELAELHGGS
jgi:hypothetical protein